MYALLPYITPAGRLQSPSPVDALIRGARKARRRAAHLDALADIKDEIEIREWWIAVHESGGAIDRCMELEMECIELTAELELAADYHLGRKLDRVGTEV